MSRPGFRGGLEARFCPGGIPMKPLPTARAEAAEMARTTSTSRSSRGTEGHGLAERWLKVSAGPERSRAGWSSGRTLSAGGVWLYQAA